VTEQIKTWLAAVVGPVGGQAPTPRQTVLVNDSPGNGGPTDGPIAARFLKALGG
jgi:hypothetical protein